VSGDSSFLVYFNGPATLADAARALSGSLHVVADGDGLLVRWAGRAEPELLIGLSDEPHVVVEATELAEQHQLPALSRCERRFEVSIDDLDAALDEMNTVAEVQMTLQDLTNGYLFNTWNGNVEPPYEPAAD